METSTVVKLLLTFIVVIVLIISVTIIETNAAHKAAAVKLATAGVHPLAIPCVLHDPMYMSSYCIAIVSKN